MDHFFQIQAIGPAEWDMNEAYTTLGFVAGVTERLRLGTIVTGVTYRHPGFLVKQVTTLDVLSGGRAWFGIGAAWFEREHRGLGIPFPPLGERFERLEETLQIALQMWSGEVKLYQGRHYQLAETLCSPMPIQRPHPPIMIGGSGEKVTLRLVAQYAQFCNVSGDPARVAGLFEALRGHCERLGRPYDEITRSIYTTVLIGRDEAEVAAKRERLADFIPQNGALIGTPAQLIERFREYAAVGCQYVVFRTPDWLDVETVRLFSDEVIPALA